MSDAVPDAVDGLRHRTMSAAAAEAIRRRILDGAYPAGAQLRQDALAAELGISRIPIREALVQLEAEGLVRLLPHRGAVVAELSADEIAELFELRALLEPHLLTLSAPHLTDDDFTALDTILAEYGDELRARTIRRWGELNTRFHALLYRHADRLRTQALVANLLQNCDRHTRLQLSATGDLTRAEAEHADLVRLCREGAVAAAADLLKRHIEHVGHALCGLLRARQADGTVDPDRRAGPA